MYRALKPGGALFFESTNKWSFTSGELGAMPCYGWLPNWARYKLRIAIHGPDIMKLGIDFHQFTYVGLRRAFREVGFSEWHDVFDLIDTSQSRGALKDGIVNTARRSRAIRELMLFFFEGTTFVCIK